MRVRSGPLVPAHELAEAALQAARGERCVVLVEDGHSAEVRFANNTTTTNGVRRDRRVTVARFVAHGGGLAVGLASGSGAAMVEDLVAAAEADAATAAPAEDAAPLLEGPSEPSFEEPAGETSMAGFAPILDDLKEAFARARSEARVLAGFGTHEVTTTYLASSTGLRRRHVDRSGTFELVGRAHDGAASAWAGRSLAELGEVSVPDLEARLVERLSFARRRVELPAGRYETILPPDAVADLVVVLGEAMAGKDAEDGWNVFSAGPGATRVGERLFDLAFDLASDPGAPGLECLPFLATPVSGSDVSVFDNGAPLGPTRWIDQGHLSRLRYHRAGAARSGVAFTPPVDNLVLSLEGAEASLDDLVASTRRGLLLTCLWYIREVDPATLLLTGLTRDGVYLVEDGEVVGAVNNFRFNESPLELLGRTLEAGRSERALSREWGEWMRNTAMPALRVADMNMSSVSPAS